MQSYLALAIALLSTTLSLTVAAPAGGPQSPPSQGVVYATLQGATPEDQLTIPIPTTSSFTPTGYGSSISHVVTSGGPCTFFGVDGLVLTVPGAGLVDVGPPQTIVGVVCGSGAPGTPRGP